MSQLHPTAPPIITFDSTAGRMHIQLLGPLRITTSDGITLKRLVSKTGDRLFAYLALQAHRPIIRQDLANLLWPTSSQQLALENLRNLLSKAKSELGAERWRLQTEDRTGVSLDLSGVITDIEAFERLAASSLFHDLLGALEIYSGPLLKDMDDEWVITHRHRLQAVYEQTLERMAQHAEADRNPAVPIDALKRALTESPNNENIARALMSAHAVSGDYTAASLVYDKLRARLRASFGSTPEVATINHIKEIKRRARQIAQDADEPLLDSEAERGVKGNLPILNGALIGRDDALIEVVAMLEGQAEGRLVTLLGAGGIGKTHLSIATAHAVSTDYPDGLFFVDLSAIRKVDGDVLPIQILSALGVNPGKMPAVEALIHFVGQGRMLLILDNCEQIVQPCCDLANRVLPVCGSLRILATSRIAMKSTRESVFTVSPLAVPKPRAADRLAEPRSNGGICLSTTQTARLARFSAVSLFIARAAEARRNFTITPQNAESISCICRMLDGIPLAIELAAAWVRSLSTDQIQAQLQARLGLLRDRHASPAMRHGTLASTVEWSYGLLPQAERRLWLALSVFPDGATLEAVRAVCCPDAPEQSVIEQITALVDSSIVVFNEHASEGRYNLPETMRSYALVHPELDNLNQSAVRLRFLQYFLTKAEEAAPHLLGAEQAIWVERLERDRANLRQAAGFAVEEAPGGELGLKLAVAIWRFYYIRGFYAEGFASLVRILEQSLASAPSLRTSAELGVGNLAFHCGEVQRARKHYNAALDLSRAAEDTSGIARALGSLSIICNKENDYSGSRLLLEECRELFLKAEDHRGLSAALQNLAVTAVHQRDYESAYRFHKESIQLVRNTTGDVQMLGTSLANLASLYLTNGEFQNAAPLLLEALSITKELRSAMVLAHCLLISLRLAVFHNWFDVAAVVIGADDMIRRSYHAPLTDDVLAEQQERIVLTQAQLSAAEYRRLYELGSAMTQDEITAYLLETFKAVV